MSHTVTSQTSWRIEHAYIVPTNLAEMRRDRVLTDLTLLVKGHSFQVHKVVLAASSPYFRALLTNQMTESFASALEVQEVAADVFEQVLSFMYTGEASVSGFRFAVQLLAAADRFLMSDLAHITLQTMKQQATVSDYPELLAEGRRLCIQDLEAFAFARCCEHFTELVSARSFLALPETLLLELLECDFLNIRDELEVLSVALAWVEAPCEEPAGRPGCWARVFRTLRFRDVDPAALPNFWPRIAPHCTDLATCRGLLCGLGGAGADRCEWVGAERERGPRWLLRKSNGPEEQAELAKHLFDFVTVCPERGHLGAVLLVRRNDARVRREVVNLTQNKFERAVIAPEAQAESEHIPRGGPLLSVAEFMTSLVEADLLSAAIIRDNVVPQLRGLSSDEARLLLCTLRHGLLQKRERAVGSSRDLVKSTIDTLVEVLESELSRARSPWMKLELKKAIEELRTETLRIEGRSC